MHFRAIDTGRIVVELVASVELPPHAVRVRSRKPPWYSYEAVITESDSRAPRSVSPTSWASASGLASSARMPRNPSGENEIVPGPQA